MIPKIAKEEFKVIHKQKNGYSYIISNMGRVIKYLDNIYEGKLMNGGMINGFKVVSINSTSYKETFYIHKKVATLFIKKEKKNSKYTLHKDSNKLNNKVSNLYWADIKLYSDYIRKHPTTIANSKARLGRGYKVDDKSKAKLVKLFKSNKVSLVKIAEEFNISVTHIYRLKSTLI